MATDKYSEKYGQLSGADLEILGAREQAATARALRTAFKPQQGQMVGGWYVKPALTQHLADALMQYNNYKNEQAGTDEAKRLIAARSLGTKNLASEMDARIKESGGKYINQPAIESDTTNADLDKLIGAMPRDAQGNPIFSDSGPITDSAPTPSATPSAMPNQGAQAYIPPTAEAQGNVNANPTNNQYMGTPSDMTASDNVPLAQAVRNAPLEGAVAGANNQSAIPQAVNGQTTNPAIPAANQASADGMLPAVTVRPEPEPAPEPAQPSMVAKILRGEGQYAPVQPASVQWQGGRPITGDEYLQWAAKAEGLGSKDLASNIMKRAEIQGHTDNAQIAANTATANAAMSDLKARQMQEIALNQANLHHIDNMAEKKDQAQARIVEAKRHDDEVAQNKLQIAQIGADARRDAAANRPEKPLTEYQGKSLAYGLRSQDANDVIEKIGTNYSPLAIDAYKKVEGVPGVGTGAYALLSDTDKQVSQAQRNFVNAVLRQESGAVISKEEFVNAQKQYFPQPGDDAATLQQKSDNRKRVISSFKTSAGRTVEGEFARPTPSAAPSAPVYIFNKATNKTMVSTDGEKTWKEVK